MKRGSEHLSVGAEALVADEEKFGIAPAFDVLIVGSGYGGAIAAEGLSAWTHDGVDAKNRLTVAVLERGLEYGQGDFPYTFEHLTAHARISGGSHAGVGGWRDGLFDFRAGDDVNVLVANGLGGGSLINAGVAERADDLTLSHRDWPAPWRNNASLWDGLYGRAELALGAQKWTAGHLPAKSAAMEQLAQKLGSTAKPVALTIAPAANGDPAGACLQCGNCFSGCNAGAKNTLGKTHLRKARANGVQIFTGATVLRVARASTEPLWEVQWTFTDGSKVPGRSQPYAITARRVILAAGVMGSTEILMRSRGPGLHFSEHLGSHFSTNGDVIGAQCELPMEVPSSAKESDPKLKVGPTITHKIELDRANAACPERRIVLQDLCVPAPLGWLFEELITTLMIPQRWMRLNWRRSDADTPNPAAVDPNVMKRTLLVAAMGHDGAAGQLHLLPGFDQAMHDGNLEVHWPQAGEAPCFAHIDRTMRDATERIKGAYWLPNPYWQAVPDSPLMDKPTDRQLLTVHPLGGCRMADSMKSGVVDPFGRVFDAGGQDEGGAPGRRGAEWVGREERRIHEGLYVLDGSIVPTSLGINPLLTISALAEGIVDEWVRDWTVPAAAISEPEELPPMAVDRWCPKAPTGSPTRVTIKERMQGLLDVGPTCGVLPEGHKLCLGIEFDFSPIEDLLKFTREGHHELEIVNARLELALTRWDKKKEHQSDIPAARPGGTAVLTGTAHWLVRRPTHVFQRIWTSLRAWFNLRARADLSGAFSKPASLTATGREDSFLTKLWSFIKVLSNFGDARYLQYTFKPLKQDLDARFKECRFTLPAGTVLSGEKALIYVPGGNPWVQLTELPLYAVIPGQRKKRLLGTLTFDETYLIKRDTLPIELGAQRDGVTSLKDLLILGLYFGRVMLQQHFLNFRRPDYALVRPLQRLPYQDAKETRFKDLDFKVFDDVHSIPQKGTDRPAVRLRLTRFRKRGAKIGHPVLLLHGFGSGGIQFAHEAIPEPLAQWLAGEGREVWIGEVRTSIGLKSCEQQWVMDDIAREDIPALVDAIRQAIAAEGRAVPKLDVAALCIGAATFCMSALSGDLHDLIRHVVLLQVGPGIQLPRSNRVRGYLGNRAQKLFGLGLVHATMDAEARAGEVFMDRIFTSMPFMAGRDQEGPHARLRDRSPSLRVSCNLQHNGRLVNAARSAAVFGQMFLWRNLYDENAKRSAQPLLDALPDLLGPCNLTTYQQTVHYVFARRLTDQDGDNAYVTDAKIQAGLNMPILFIQGALNDVFSPEGTLDSQKMLRNALPQGSIVERLLVPDFGHFDCVVGRGAVRRVFKPLLRFLDSPVNYCEAIRAPNCDAVSKPTTPDTPKRQYRWPSIGPWLGDAKPDGAAINLTLGLKLDERASLPDSIQTMLCNAKGPIADTLVVHACGAMPGWPDAIKQVEAAAHWEEGEAIVRVSVDKAHWGSDIEVWACTVRHAGTNFTKADFVEAWWTAWNKETNWPDGVKAGRIKLDAAWLQAQTQTKPAPETLSFVVLSCRQTPLLVDRSLADEGFGRLLSECPGLNHVMMIGDQIYADALAASGGVEGSSLRFYDLYREAWTAPFQRQVMARRPIYMAADDHEFRNDHSGAVRLDRRSEWRIARGAMWRYEYAAGPAGVPDAQTPQARTWYEMSHRGFSTFVCDTRNLRHDDGTVGCERSRIMPGRQLKDIEAWLEKSRETGRPRFLVMPTPIAPVFRNCIERPEYRVRSDTWMRYPRSLEALFELLFADKAKNLIVISGDFHCFYDCEVKLWRKGNGEELVSFRSVTVPGIYSPYDFANSDPQEFWAPGEEDRLTTGPFTWTYERKHAEKTSGYVRFTVGSGPVKVELKESRIGGAPRPMRSVKLPLDSPSRVLDLIVRQPAKVEVTDERETSLPS